MRNRCIQNVFSTSAFIKQSFLQNGDSSFRYPGIKENYFPDFPHISRVKTFDSGEAMKRMQRFVMNALILTGTSLLMNAVGVWFNIYIAKKIGTQGMGIFQLIMSVYSLAVTFATSGINLASTRLVAEELGRNCRNIRPAMRRCLGYSCFFGAATGVLLFYGAPWIGLYCLGSGDTIRPLKAMAFSMPFLSMSCALGGYFNAVGRVAKSAVSSVFEQFLKITLSMIALTLLMPPGLEYACLAITGSGVVAEGLSWLLAFFFYQTDSHRYQGPNRTNCRLLRRMLGIALPVAASSYLRTGLTTIKNLLVPIRLQAGGLSSGASLSMFGAVHGLALPVILFPAAFLNSFSNLSIPEIARRHSLGQPIGHLMERLISFNLFCSLAICGILFSFPQQIASFLSPNPDVAVYIRLLAPVVPVMYLDTAVDCMLKGLDEQVAVMRYNVLDAATSMFSVYFLLPVLGIKGYIFVIIFSEVFNFFLSLSRLVKVSRFSFDLYEKLFKPLCCISISVLLVKLLFRSGVLPSINGVLGAAMPIVLSSAGYLLLLRLTDYQNQAKSTC